MSWILTRKKDGIKQMYRNPDIYGRGKFMSNEESKWYDLPVIYSQKRYAHSVMLSEQKKDPDWEYEVSFYDR